MAFVTGSKRYCSISSLAKVKVSLSKVKGRARWSGDGPISTSLWPLRTRGVGLRRAAQGKFAAHYQDIRHEGGGRGLNQRTETARNRCFEPDRLPRSGRAEDFDGAQRGELQSRQGWDNRIILGDHPG